MHILRPQNKNLSLILRLHRRTKSSNEVRCPRLTKCGERSWLVEKEHPGNQVINSVIGSEVVKQTGKDSGINVADIISLRKILG